MANTNDRTTFERKIGRDFFRDFLPAVIGYCVITVALVVLVDFENAGAWKYLVALLPLLPALWGLRAIGRHLQRVDELGRQDLLTAIAVGFGVAMVTAITIAFLNLAGLDSRYWGAWSIYGAGMAGWSIAGIRLQASHG